MGFHVDTYSIKKVIRRSHFVCFRQQIGSFLRWIHESSSQLKERGFEQSSKVWSGMEIVTVMEKQGITPGTFYVYFVCVSDLLNHYLQQFSIPAEAKGIPQ